MEQQSFDIFFNSQICCTGLSALHTTKIKINRGNVKTYCTFMQPHFKCYSTFPSPDMYLNVYVMYVATTSSSYESTIHICVVNVMPKMIHLRIKKLTATSIINLIKFYHPTFYTGGNMSGKDNFLGTTRSQ